MSATLADWLELMGLKPIFDDLFAGSTTVQNAEAAVAAAKRSYPGVSQDYVAILGLADRVTVEVRRIIADQEQAVNELNDAISEYAEFAYEPNRLLREDEMEEIQRLLRRINDDRAAAAEEAEELAEEIERLQDEIERLAGDLEAGVEDAAADLEAAADELEEAAEELESFNE